MHSRGSVKVGFYSCTIVYAPRNKNVHSKNANPAPTLMDPSAMEDAYSLVGAAVKPRYRI